MRVAPIFMLLLGGCAVLPQGVPDGSRATLALLETSDLHAAVLGYDYYKLAADPTYGLERTATLIAQARSEFPDNLLIDNGDTLQGNALADYQAGAGVLPCSEPLAIHKAMNALHFDAGTVGNHDFDYGLPFLMRAAGQGCAGAAFPLVLANVHSRSTGKPLFRPYIIADKRVHATGPDGREVPATVKVGIVGLTTPVINQWNRKALDGQAVAEGIVETARKVIPQMRAEGADIIVAVSHGGLDDAAYSPEMENGSWHLAQVPGIDAMLTGHAHQVFPNASGTAPAYRLPGVDRVKGTVFGVPAVMAGQWGKQLGVIGLALKREQGRWVVDRGRTVAQVRSVTAQTAPDPAIAALVRNEHAAAMRYVQAPLGRTDYRMATYFADIGDVSAIEPVNQAQTAFLAAHVKTNLPQYAGLPVLSMSAPFKSGMAGPGDYTDVKAGSLALNNAADLYLYPNALHGVKITGSQLRAWLEKAAERFNTIDPARKDEQELVNEAFAGYNFDMVTDSRLQYRIDVTQPPGHRIKGLAYQGRLVADEMPFIVATNSYRASGGGNFPGLDGSKTIFASPDASRDVLIAYIRHAQALNRAANGSARSWRFQPVHASGPVVIHSAPGMLQVARDAGLGNVRELRPDDGKGYAVYAVDLAVD
ncbi:bifunctional 2',3'-cyclic-nucleotide 2'-phosphodiesterase/3'-nucleotidase [Pseudoduganella ginsengisoli]|uniref:Bifunctional 2',3'-cyclic-nucleotide 2'-phosphodiesterase/3'-nucleotidase n=1 Tax=Pseudoduganella ginsengisoli TaxID=1462440 RepID=A0A6L6Q645_9BURK|nr:bifunctional 2',3'-cyclic-nucleotide 2'-phosphodiesterase/3'-nucleotidase [Pseudoduganella ginsengisoli]MTW04718.1 bifunctional 2',3'-cyclic-nucleotide 2'-phosphodiesterase/3'-nucleotidase [Pseudoduganella ginsengisoli]